MSSEQPDYTGTTTTFPRDPKFYLDTAIFLVEEHLFKVPRNQFEEHSPVFRDMFSLPQGPGEKVIHEGLNDENPIRLEGVSAADFRHLLDVMFEFPKFPVPLPDRSGIMAVREANQAQWESALRLSTLWQFEGIRLRAIEILEHRLSGDPIRRIVLARAFNIKQWFSPAFTQLVTQEAGLNPEDGEKDRLGIHTALTVASLREEIFKEGHPSKHYLEIQCRDCGRANGAQVDCPYNRTAYPMTLTEGAKQKIGTLL